MNPMSAHVEHLTVSDDDLLRMTIMNKTVVTERGCWEWQGGRARDGYGLMMRKRKRMYVHRVAYELWKQVIPEGMVVRHGCDNPCCVNPDHLSHGTQAQNIADIVERGRMGGQKLVAEQVRAIRSSTELTATLAARFGVGVMSIIRARNGTTWSHVENYRGRKIGKGHSAATGAGPQSKITATDADVIRSSNLSTWLLASIYGLTRKSIANIRNGHTWKVVTRNMGVQSGAN